MNSRRQFISKGSLGILSALILPSPAFSNENPEFEGIVVNGDEGEAVRMRDGTAIVKIKISKTQGAKSICFLSESFKPGDSLPVHKHLNEDELIFLLKGSGLFTLGNQQYPISEGAVAMVPRGIWHGLQNTGDEDIEIRFAYTPSGFEGFFREVGTPVGQPFVKKSMEQRKAIAKKWGMIYKS
ncbi:MAG: cupin domain-containing protein [Bacteroidota bacterium]|nr:cupin domain-containing protein [Bacteroidota bacterium]